jgi:hypothetical protein
MIELYDPIYVCCNDCMRCIRPVRRSQKSSLEKRRRSAICCVELDLTSRDNKCRCVWVFAGHCQTTIVRPQFATCSSGGSGRRPSLATRDVRCSAYHYYLSCQNVSGCTRCILRSQRIFHCHTMLSPPVVCATASSRQHTISAGKQSETPCC